MNNFFQPEIEVLDMVKENMTNGFKYKDTVVCMYEFGGQAADGGRDCIEIYHAALEEDRQDTEEYRDYFSASRVYCYCLADRDVKLNRSSKNHPGLIKNAYATPHVISFISSVDKRGELCVDVCGFGNGDTGGFIDLSMAMTEAITDLRSGSCRVSMMQCVGKNVSSVPFAPGLITESVREWIKESSEFQKWKDITRPYLRGLFKKPDYARLGHDMIMAMRDSIRKKAKEFGSEGTFVMSFTPKYAAIDEMFGNFCDDGVPTPVTVTFRTNAKHLKVVFRENMPEIKFAFVFEGVDDEGRMKPVSLLDIKITLAMEMSDLDEQILEYQGAIKETAWPYLNMWQKMELTSNIKCWMES